MSLNVNSETKHAVLLTFDSILKLIEERENRESGIGVVCAALAHSSLIYVNIIVISLFETQPSNKTHSKWKSERYRISYSVMSVEHCQYYQVCCHQKP